MSPAVANVAAGAVRSADDFFATLATTLAAGARLVTFFARPAGDDGAAAELVLTAALETAAGLEVLRTAIARDHGFASLTPAFPALHVFEREIFEQHGARPHGHPWLKPLRFPEARLDSYPFYRINGKEVHEVGVGPVHAGVIEPGHFRFMCLGETVLHLEIQLGYQHRDVLALLRRRDPRALAPLVETIVGDTSIGHAWAYAAAIEALAGVELAPEVALGRAVGLELERIAMHLAGLSALAGDIAFLPGAATYGRLRTTIINTSMLLCGSRFGRGWIRPGGDRARLEGAVGDEVRANLALVAHDVAIIDALMLSARSVRHRLEGTGVLTEARARELGLVGPAARASGVELDRRASAAESPYRRHPITTVVEAGGDCWARARVRMRELDASLRWLTSALADAVAPRAPAVAPGALAPDRLVIARQEGWRGEVVHCLETDAAGRLCDYRVQDPSLRNWIGLALAMRGNDISDFPICNKSFDLSYCGNDL